jgi:hypothetical protein
MPDQQAGIEMPQLMKARPSRRARGLDGSPPHIPERGATDGIACGCDEHEPIAERREGAQVRGEGIEHDLRQRDGAHARRRLGRGQERRTASHGYELSIHMHHAAQEVEPVHSEPQAFALTHSRASSQDHKRAISGGHCVS